MTLRDYALPVTRVLNPCWRRDVKEHLQSQHFSIARGSHGFLKTRVTRGRIAQGHLGSRDSYVRYMTSKGSSAKGTISPSCFICRNTPGDEAPNCQLII